MADNVTANTSDSGGPTFATDDAGGVHWPYSKIAYGADNAQTPVSTAAPLPVVQTGTPALPSGAATETTLSSVLSALGGTLTMSGTVAISGSVTVTATNLDIRDLSSASDSVSAVQSGAWNVGVTGAVAVTDNSGSLTVDDGGSSLTVDGTVAATQSGTWTIGNAAGASAVNIQDGGNSITVDGTVAATQSGTWNIGTLTTLTNWGNIVDNAAFTDGTTRLLMGGYIFDETAGTALTENDGAAARVDSKRAQVFTLEDASTRGRRATISASGALLVDASATTQPVSGTVTATPGSNGSTTAATFAQGVKTVSAAATPEALVGVSTKVETVTIQAKKGFNTANTSAVFVGFSASNDSNYLELLPGDSVSFNAPSGKKLDLSLIYVEVVTNGDGVTYTSVN